MAYLSLFFSVLPPSGKSTAKVLFIGVLYNYNYIYIYIYIYVYVYVFFFCFIEQNCPNKMAGCQ